MPGPAGKKMGDGFPTTITFSADANIAIWEKEVQPPGSEQGGANDTTTMRNSLWRTRQPKKLKTLSDCTGNGLYDPRVYSDIQNQSGNNQLITVNFPDGSKLSFWGWLDEAKPARMKEGDPPTIDWKIIPSNQDNTGAEVAPTYTAPSSTTATTTTTLP